MSLNSVIKTSEECRIVNFGGGSNYHTHTYYCDGKNSPKEMVERAVELGFHSLGFSGHQYSPQDADYAMSFESEKKYRSDIEALQEEYKGIINFISNNTNIIRIDPHKISKKSLINPSIAI